jgi:serine/threonine-protein kinase
MPPHIACDFILQAAEALAEAHGLGMIHRDVKLKNLFRTATVDGRPLVKVLDFGLAKQTGIGGTDVSLTATSSVFGSPQYMSPEQMRSAKDVDTRSDIWSIGVCLYELLTGRVPFDAGGVAEICAMVLKDPVTPPSRWVRGLPPDLEAVVLRCLEKDPTRRFQTVAELAFALEPYAADEGSARRILHVMETAKKVEMPTIVSDGMPPTMEDVRAGTMAAFSTGSQAVTPKFPVWIPVGIVGAVMFLVGAGLIVTYWGAAHKRTLATQPSGEVATISSGVETAVPPPPPIPTDTNAVGTVIGTSEPNAPAVATTTTATAAQPRATGRPATPTFGAQRTPPTKPPATAPTVATKPTAVPPPVVPTGAPTPTNKDPGARY